MSKKKETIVEHLHFWICNKHYLYIRLFIYFCLKKKQTKNDNQIKTVFFLFDQFVNEESAKKRRCRRKQEKKRDRKWIEVKMRLFLDRSAACPIHSKRCFSSCERLKRKRIWFVMHLSMCMKRLWCESVTRCLGYPYTVTLWRDERKFDWIYCANLRRKANERER